MKSRLACCVLAILASAALSARFVMPEIRKVPVQRLAENIERQLQQKPDDVQLRLNLARLYAMAFALKVSEFDARSTGGENLQAWFGHVASHIPGPAKAAPTREHQQRAEADLARAMDLYRDVLARAPDNFIAHLGYGWTLEQAGKKADATNEYRKVVALAWPVEQERNHFMMGQEPATVEAAGRLQVLLDPGKDATELAALTEKVAELNRMGRGITPIAIPLRDGVTEPPLDNDARVLFDADGSGISRRWTWIKKDAGWLVYDAEGSGEITSALQWFGNVTFWLFWSNGYQALAALDDNGDGELHGAELRNLAIWRDRNQNGLSERGEVRPLAAHGIAALSCAYVPGDGETIAAWSPGGVVLGDGSRRTSYDVILRTVGRQVTVTSPVH